MSAASPRSAPSGGMAVLRADERFVKALAEIVAARVVECLDTDRRDEEGVLDADGAARYLATTRRRIHQITSSGALRPDGHDGRRPLFRRASLDRYMEGGAEP